MYLLPYYNPVMYDCCMLELWLWCQWNFWSVWRNADSVSIHVIIVIVTVITHSDYVIAMCIATIPQVVSITKFWNGSYRLCNTISVTELTSWWCALKYSVSNEYLPVWIQDVVLDDMYYNNPITNCNILVMWCQVTKDRILWGGISSCT